MTYFDMSWFVTTIFLSFDTGFIIDFISAPVTSGFTSAYSIIIIASQLKSLFGLQKFKTKGFIDNINQLITHMHELKIWDTIYGVFCIIFLLILWVRFCFQCLFNNINSPLAQWIKNKLQYFVCHKIFLA
jgi:MFS superfamily sulfate permease-like transporter